MNAKSSKVIECDIALAPVEVFYRHGTLSNLATFIEHLGVKDPPSKNETDSNSKDCGNHQILLSASCPSITFSIPMIREVNTTPLFSRCGEILENSPIRQSALGILLKEFTISYDGGHKKENSAAASGSATNFSCHHFLAFALAPLGSGIAVGSKMQRTDIAIGRGRMEVNPCIPVSLDCRFGLCDDQDENHGRKSFPVVPLISSFKARQEDDDEEAQIDRLLFSKLQRVDADSRRELKGSDQQSSMLSAAERCSIVVVIGIPEIVVDVSIREIEVILMMVEAALPPPTRRLDPAGTPDVKESELVACAINCDLISLGLHRDQAYPTSESEGVFSYYLMLGHFKTHSILAGSKMKHIRLLCHEPAFYEGKH